jgi:hypothetical protein
LFSISIRTFPHIHPLLNNKIATCPR